VLDEEAILALGGEDLHELGAVGRDRLRHRARLHRRALGSDRRAGRRSRPCARSTREGAVDAAERRLLVAYAAATVLYLALPRAAAAPGPGGRIHPGPRLGCTDRGHRDPMRALQHPASSTPEAMAFIAWTLVAGFLLASLRYRLEAAGAFAVPGAVILLLLARVVPRGRGGAGRALMNRAHLPGHAGSGHLRAGLDHRGPLPGPGAAPQAQAARSPARRRARRWTPSIGWRPAACRSASPSSPWPW
jgi:hypothetical protein